MREGVPNLVPAGAMKWSSLPRLTLHWEVAARSLWHRARKTWHSVASKSELKGIRACHAMADAPAKKIPLLSSCTCSGASSARASPCPASSACSALARSFFVACHAFFAADRLEGGMGSRERTALMYLPTKDTDGMRARSAVDVGRQLVHWQRNDWATSRPTSQ